MNTLWMILLSALVSLGCSANPVSADPGASLVTPVSDSSAGQTDGVVNIRFDEVVTYDHLELRWREISDSRCPTGAQCVWAGEVKVILEATCTLSEGNEPREIQLMMQARRKPATTTIFGYEVELLDVAPYPKDGMTPERSRYMATIRFSDARARPDRDQQGSL